MTAKPAKPVKHVPQRTCVGCHTVRAKRTLVRVVRTSEGVMVDPTGKLNGRGAYLHNSRSCWERGLSGALKNALKVELTIEDKQRLEAFKDSLPTESSVE